MSRLSDNRITVVRAGLPLPVAEPGEVVVSDADIRSSVLSRRALRSVGRYRTSRLLTERLSTSGRPMLAWVLRLMARDRCYIADAEGHERDLTLGLLLRWSWQLTREVMEKDALLRRAGREVHEAAQVPRGPSTPHRQRARAPLYVRTALSFGPPPPRSLRPS